MSVKTLFIIFFILVSLGCFGQTQVLPVVKPGEPTLAEISKNSHIVKQKLPGDSAWLARQFDMHDSLMISCTFKDENLTIPNGRFFNYTYPPLELRITFNYVTHKNDSVFTKPKNRLLGTGFFVNGLKTGNWCDYDETGFITHITCFDNGKENGLYQSFNSETKKVILVGHYIDGKREGRWNIVSFNGDTIQTEIYKNNQIVKTISNISQSKFKYQIGDGKPAYNFEKYLNAKLAEHVIKEPGVIMHNYAFDLTTEGKLINPIVISKQNMAIDTVIIDAIMAAPNWKPALYNGVVTTVNIPMKIETDISANGRAILTLSDYYIYPNSLKKFISTTNKIIAPN